MDARKSDCYIIIIVSTEKDKKREFNFLFSRLKLITRLKAVKEESHKYRTFIGWLDIKAAIYMYATN